MHRYVTGRKLNGPVRYYHGNRWTDQRGLESTMPMMSMQTVRTPLADWSVSFRGRNRSGHRFQRRSVYVRGTNQEVLVPFAPRLLAGCAALEERCPPRQRSGVECLKAKVEALLSLVTVEYHADEEDSNVGEERGVGVLPLPLCISLPPSLSLALPPAPLLPLYIAWY